MKTANRELLDRLAAEYALGTLHGPARRRFERWLLSPKVTVLVRDWEERLEGLEPPEEQITPPPGHVWRDIENRLELRKLERIPARRRIGIASVLLLTVLALALVIARTV